METNHTSQINNQATLLLENDHLSPKLNRLAEMGENGDPDNCEAQAAASLLEAFVSRHDFVRERFGVAPNGLLNYGYTILR